MDSPLNLSFLLRSPQSSLVFIFIIILFSLALCFPDNHGFESISVLKFPGFLFVTAYLSCEHESDDL